MKNFSEMTAEEVHNHSLALEKHVAEFGAAVDEYADAVGEYQKAADNYCKVLDNYCAEMEKILFGTVETEATKNNAEHFEKCSA